MVQQKGVSGSGKCERILLEDFTLAFFFVFEVFWGFVFYCILLSVLYFCTLSRLKCVFFFFSCRQQLLKVAFESPPISPKTPASAIKCKTPKEKGQECKSSFLSNYFQKKPKTWLQSSFNKPGGQKETCGSHHSKKVDLHSPSTLLVVKEEPTNAVEENIQLLKSVKQEDTACNSHTSTPEVTHSSSPSKDIKPTIKGEASLSLVQGDAQGLRVISE